MSTATETKERPILFSAAMVRAILEGRKRQTRRVVKLPNFNPTEHDGMYMWSHPNNPTNAVQYAWGAVSNPRLPPCPYGVPGDRLWVRETWRHVDERTVYAATPESNHLAWDGWTWRPSIHMPRWASRITLEVTGVRVERVQSISEADARAEGVTERTMTFAALWDSINAARGYGWDSNPWVWVVEFKRI